MIRTVDGVAVTTTAAVLPLLTIKTLVKGKCHAGTQWEDGYSSTHS
jgi:hypothetical protein